jgi:hypothetical protein
LVRRWFSHGSGAVGVLFVLVAGTMKPFTRYTFTAFAVGFGLSSMFGVVIEWQGVLVGVCGVASGVCAAINK